MPGLSVAEHQKLPVGELMMAAVIRIMYNISRNLIKRVRPDALPQRSIHSFSTRNPLDTARKTVPGNDNEYVRNMATASLHGCT